MRGRVELCVSEADKQQRLLLLVDLKEECESVCVYVCVKKRKRNAIRDKNRQIKKGGVLKGFEAEDKKHELAVLKPEGIERGMSDVVRTYKDYNPRAERKKLMVGYFLISSESTN